jgi:nucleotide-binding universal stress UspA family protein
MNSEKEIHRARKMLVSVDFSECCRLALRKALDLVADRKTKIIVLHVIDQRFVKDCLNTGLFIEDDVKKKLFLDAKAKLKALVEEELPERIVKSIVCKGVPCMEINRKAEEFDADIIVIGSCGMAGDHENIFFGGTAEKVMRFTQRPVFCVPPNARKSAPSPV